MHGEGDSEVIEHSLDLPPAIENSIDCVCMYRRNAKILILDEATANVDAETDALIQVLQLPRSLSLYLLTFSIFISPFLSDSLASRLDLICVCVSVCVRVCMCVCVQATVRSELNSVTVLSIAHRLHTIAFYDKVHDTCCVMPR